MDSARRPWPPAHLRAGDADRQAVVAELQQHYVQGRLTSDELGERVAQALAARTFGDFDQLLADLPALHPVRPEPLQDGRADARPGGWHLSTLSPPLGAALILVGLLALLWILALPGQHFGIFPFWPILIWGFFSIGGRPRGGRRF